MHRGCINLLSVYNSVACLCLSMLVNACHGFAQCLQKLQQTVSLHQSVLFILHTIPSSPVGYTCMEANMHFLRHSKNTLDFLVATFSAHVKMGFGKTMENDWSKCNKLRNFCFSQAQGMSDRYQSFIEERLKSLEDRYKFSSGLQDSCQPLAISNIVLFHYHWGWYYLVFDC